MSPVFTEAERSAWAKPKKLLPSEWAERNRVLRNGVAAEAGRLRLARTPYMRGVLDAIAEPGIERIIFLKSAQAGASTGTESAIGYWIDQDPGPIMLVLDSEKTAKEVLVERLRPMLEREPLRSHLSVRKGDNKLDGIAFDSCSLFVAWAGSPATLARRAIRYVVFDEVDKYPHFTGKEADPISLGAERTQTYGYRAKQLILSTPTVRTGAIWRAWESCTDRRRFYVPCARCGHFQPMVFGQIKFPHRKEADPKLEANKIERQSLATYECIKCRKLIADSKRLQMVRDGRWISEGHQTIDKRGKIHGALPGVPDVGFWINSLYSPWRSWSKIAAKFLRTKDNPFELQNFKNSWLAEIFEEVIKSSTVDDFRSLMDGAPPPLIVPGWAEYIIASADVQADRMYWAVRAWGAGFKSRLITYGIAVSFAELKKRALDMQFDLEAGGTSPAHLLMVDSGHRTDEVYQFARSDERIKPVKGGSDDQAMPVCHSNAGIKWGVPLLMLNTQLLKDRLSVLRATKRWELNSAVEEDYLKQLASEHKVITNGVEMWKPKTTGQPNHRLDVEVYNVAGAEFARVDLLESKESDASAAE